MDSASVYVVLDQIFHHALQVHCCREGSGIEDYSRTDSAFDVGQKRFRRFLQVGRQIVLQQNECQIFRRGLSKTIRPICPRQPVKAAQKRELIPAKISVTHLVKENTFGVGDHLVHHVGSKI